MAYIIKWYDTDTGESGQGKPNNDISILRGWVDEMNKKHPHIKHWVEAVPDEYQEPTRTPGLGAFDRDWSGLTIKPKERKG